MTAYLLMDFGYQAWAFRKENSLPVYCYMYPKSWFLAMTRAVPVFLSLDSNHKIVVI